MNVWTCTACNFPIADGAGTVAAPCSEIADPPMFGITWQPRHTRCADDLHDYYGVPVEELRDPAGVLTWTAHLLGKVWVANSNWDDVIRTTLKEGARCG